MWEVWIKPSHFIVSVKWSGSSCVKMHVYCASLLCTKRLECREKGESTGNNRKSGCNFLCLLLFFNIRSVTSFDQNNIDQEHDCFSWFARGLRVGLCVRSEPGAGRLHLQQPYFQRSRWYLQVSVPFEFWRCFVFIFIRTWQSKAIRSSDNFFLVATILFCIFAAFNLLLSLLRSADTRMQWSAWLPWRTARIVISSTPSPVESNTCATIREKVGYFRAFAVNQEWRLL